MSPVETVPSQVVIDTTNAAPSLSGGVGVYAHHLTPALALRCRSKGARLQVCDFWEGESFGGRNLPDGSFYYAPSPPRGDYLFHALSYFRPVEPRLCRTARVRVATLHDLIDLHYPYLFSPEERAKRQVAYARLASDVDVVITPTSAVADDVHRLLNFDRQRVVSVSHGNESLLEHDAQAPDFARLLGGRPFMIYPARAYPHKNHLRLLQALWLLLRGCASARDFVLVLVMGDWRHRRHDFSRLIGSHGLGDNILVTDHVAPSELRWLYENAAFMIFPSLVEGYGLPVGEAIASGCPLVLSDIPTLREVGGGKDAIWVDPTDVSSIAHGLERAVLERPARWEGSVRTWDTVAADTMEAYGLAHG